MYKRLKENKGVTLISLVILVVMLMILSSAIILNINDKYSSQKLDMLASDLQLLTEKTGIYYSENKVYPIGDAVAFSINGVTINNGYKISLEKLGGLTLNYGKEESNDDYYVIDISTGMVYYKKGIDGIYSFAQVQVINENEIKILKISTQPQWKTAEEGESVEFFVTVDTTGINTEYLIYEWYKEGTTDKLKDGTKVTGSATSNLTIKNVTSDDSGYYYCVITYNDTNELKRKTELAKLEVKEAGEVEFTVDGVSYKVVKGTKWSEVIGDGSRIVPCSVCNTFDMIYWETSTSLNCFGCGAVTYRIEDSTGTVITRNDVIESKSYYLKN